MPNAAGKPTACAVLQAAYYSFAQFTTSYAWGLLSNRCGRKVSSGWLAGR
jgi:hypothetical protein